MSSGSSDRVPGTHLHNYSNLNSIKHYNTKFEILTSDTFASIANKVSRATIRMFLTLAHCKDTLKQEFSQKLLKWYL